jgi:hypothetical protein
VFSSPRRSLIALLVVGVFAVASQSTTPEAAAANCGKQVINAYFNTGKLGYHTQDCYASALKQVDPDARMYSGIMSAIRAARARDRAADEKANAPATTEETPVETQSLEPVETLPVTTEIQPTETVEPIITAVPRTGPTQDQAAVDTSGAEPSVPLPVIILGGLATLLTVVGLGGLVVRRLDRGY